ncbi:MAG: hypothetical protein WCR21_12615 [Bacteroidota bacterium]
MKKIILFLLAFQSVCFAQNIKTELTYSVFSANQSIKGRALLIVMHGYGSNENDLLNLAKQVAPQCVIVSLRAPIQVNQDGYCWYNIERLPGKQIKYNYAQVIESRNKVQSFIYQFCKNTQADSNNIYLMGFSQGAMMSYEMLLQSNLNIKGIVALSGRLINESCLSTKHALSLKQKNIFITHGTQDEVIDPVEYTKASAYFKQQEVKQLFMKTYPMGHTISQEEVTDIKMWLDKATIH